MILVTGATGNVGKELVRELSSRGVAFRAAYTSLEKAEKGRSAHVQPVIMDFGKADSLPAALAGVETLFLVSSNPPSESAVVAAAKGAGVRRIVKLSVFDAQGEAFGFARLHRAVERKIESSGLAFTFLRPNGFFQNMANQQAGSIKARGAFFFPAGDTRISHVDVRDIARAAAAALTEGGHEGKAYTLTGPEALTYGDIAASLTRVLGKPVSYVAISDDDFRKAMADLGAPAPLVEALVDLFTFYRSGRAATVSGDLAKVTGRAPTSFETWARDHAAAFR